MPRWILMLVALLGVISVGGIAGWYAYEDANYVSSGFASVTSPYVWIKAPEAGQITKVAVTAGEVVTKNQTLFQESGGVTIRAKTSGIAGSVAVTRGSLVTPGEDLGAVVNMSRATVVAEVPESKTSKLSLGQTVDVHLAENPGTDYRGVVSRLGAVTLATLSPILQVGTFAKARQWVPVTVTLLNPPDNLRDGENASIKIHI